MLICLTKTITYFMESKKIDLKIGLFLRKQRLQKEFSPEFMANQFNISRNTY